MKPTETILAALRWRYATKQFDPSKKIDEATWQALEETLVLSPSSFGLQPWKFFVVTNPEVRQQLVPLSWGQTQVVDASHLVIFAVKHPVTADDVRKHILRTAEVRSLPVEQLSGFEAVVNGFISKPESEFDVRSWATRQLYIAFGNFMTAAALLGVDTCPMEGLDPAGYDKVLGLEGSGYFTVAACPAGYRAETDKYAKLPKVRFEKSQVIQYI
ncbi:MAG: NAD(P)H-dependent oxidoreductase [Verrucomicrobia bacterium 61-8]|nr:NAD(P)H-dependent oxidoreductase [Verrucomicrobiota bacterium]OJV20439.1 MAG: NAD(P)H-dependent oxidoreductase [Verrucomicrobia bacterium 61-8]